MVKTRQAWKCSSSVAYTVDISLLNSEILPYIGHHLAISPELTFPPSCEISCYVIDNDRSIGRSTSKKVVGGADALSEARWRDGMRCLCGAAAAANGVKRSARRKRKRTRWLEAAVVGDAMAGLESGAHEMRGGGSGAGQVNLGV